MPPKGPRWDRGSPELTGPAPVPAPPPQPRVPGALREALRDMGGVAKEGVARWAWSRRGRGLPAPLFPYDASGVNFV